MLILVDSGILLRLFNPADPLCAMVDAAVRLLHSQGNKLTYALQNAAEFWNVCTRPSSARGGLGLDVAETERRMQLVEAGFSLLAEPTTAYTAWRKLVVTHSVMGKQVHDARLVALMQSYGITQILTLNGSDFTRYPGIVPLEPSSVIAIPPSPTS